MTDKLDTDLNETIASAVKARVEAEVLKALSGEEVIGRYVAAAMVRPVPTKDRYGNTSSRDMEPFVTKVLREAIEECTKAAVRAVIETELPNIENEVRKALRRDIAGIASSLTKTLADAAVKAYGVNVEMTLRMPGS